VRRSARAVYVTLNPFDRERIADSGVSDDAVTRRHWLPIDVDPIRDDPKTNATDGSALRPQWPKASSTDERRGEMARHWKPEGQYLCSTRRRKPEVCTNTLVRYAVRNQNHPTVNAASVPNLFH
jgi:hypothetical protein